MVDNIFHIGLFRFIYWIISSIIESFGIELVVYMDDLIWIKSLMTEKSHYK